MSERLWAPPGDPKREEILRKNLRQGLSKVYAAHQTEGARKMFMCKLCSKVYSRATSLHRHYSLECEALTFDRLHDCPFCPFRCEYKRTFVEHLMFHHGKTMARFVK